MNEKIKQILLDILDNLNDSKYELENIELENIEEEEKIKRVLGEIIDDLDNIINKIEELVE